MVRIAWHRLRLVALTYYALWLGKVTNLTAQYVSWTFVYQQKT